MNPIKATLVNIGRFHLFDLARELSRRGMLQSIFTGYPKWKLNDEGIPAKLIETIPWLQTPYMALSKFGLLKEGRFQRDLAWYAHETLDGHVARKLSETDVLFALSGSGLKCGRLAQELGAKYICDRGSSHIRYQASILNEEFARWGIKFPGIDPRIVEKEEAEYAAADIITVPSGFAYHSFMKMGVPEAKLRKVPYGVDIRRFKKVASPETDGFEVLFVGQVGFRKGVPDLLEAFRRFRHPKKRLSLIGGMCSEMNPYLKQFPSAGKFEFLGHIPQPELKYYMSRAHVMVLPSIEDGFGLVQAQAMACGCPVIASRNTGAEDLFTNGKEGFIVPIREPQTIADKLQFLADNSDCRSAMSDAALKRVLELGGWADYGQRMAGVFKRLFEGADYLPV